MKRIGLMMPNSFDATSLYRGWGVFGDLRGIEIHKLGTIDWNTVKPLDILFMQRPYSDTGIKAIEFAKMLGKKVWVDHDDYLHGITIDNPDYAVYSNPKIIANIEQAMKLADVVTVSTPRLKEMYSRFNAFMEVIPNAYDRSYHGEPMAPGMNKVITWRGGSTHEASLMEVGDTLISFLEKNKVWSMQFIGMCPWRLAKKLPSNARIMQHTDPFFFMKHFKSLNPSIHIAPLASTVFNQCKSNITWIEATIAGAAVIASDFSQFRQPGITTYSSIDGLEDSLNDLSKDPELRKNNRETSLMHIMNHLNLSSINKQRASIIEAL